MVATIKSHRLTQQDVAALEQRLSSLAYEWRSADGVNPTTATKLVQDYQQVAAELQQRGWRGDGLSADAMLPNSLMPAFLQHA